LDRMKTSGNSNGLTVH